MVSPSSNQKVAVVTGSSSGTGFETSLTLARNRFYTYATVRKLEAGSNQIRSARPESFQSVLVVVFLVMVVYTKSHGRLH